MADSRPILCVGLVCLDIVNLCEGYPVEDVDVRAKDQRWTSGGNAANSCIVLSLIGRRCEFMGTLGHGMETDFVVSRLDKYGIDHSNCVYHTSCALPTSYVVLNTLNGSRTIVHYRNLPELSAEDFSKIDLSRYSWIQIEGRCPEQDSKMIQQIAAYNEAGEHGEGRTPLRVSVELEKAHKPGMDQLAPLADVLLISKEYAQCNGCHTMEETVVRFRDSAKKNAIIVCAWGDKGAAATDMEGKVHTCAAYPPPKLEDTLGAGDTFNAGFIHQLSRGSSVERALQFGCQLAGAKCGMYGFDGLTSFKDQEPP